MPEGTVGFELMTLAHLMRRELDNAIPPTQPQQLTGTTIRLTCFLYQNRTRDIFQRDIEKGFGVRPSTVSANLRLMEKNGLIVRKSVAQDARLKKIVLTEQAVQFYGEMEQKRASVERRLTQSLTKKEVETLITLLRKAKRSFSNPTSDEQDTRQRKEL